MSSFPCALAVFLAAACLATAAADLGMLKITEGAWEFKIVLDTHSRDLSDDLMKTAMLVSDAGRSHLPVAWVGAAGEAKPRSFRWDIK
jgi:hypothetical protein